MATDKGWINQQNRVSGIVLHSGLQTTRKLAEAESESVIGTLISGPNALKTTCGPFSAPKSFRS